MTGFERPPIVKGSVEDWWNGLTSKEKVKYAGATNAHKKWVELSQTMRSSLAIRTLSLKRG